MTLKALAEDPFEILVGRILDGTLSATPEGITLVVWICDLDGLQAKVNVLKALQGETEKELAALLPSVLDRAFSGQL